VHRRNGLGAIRLCPVGLAALRGAGTSSGTADACNRTMRQTGADYGPRNIRNLAGGLAVNVPLLLLRSGTQPAAL